MEIIHINVHYAVGIIIASISNYFIGLTLFEFILIVFCSFLMDFDIILSKYARDNNHRMLITHSIIPALLIILIGLIMTWPALIIGGIAYLIHVIIDTFDWGTNFFGVNKNPWGLKLLISKQELKNLETILKDFKIKKSFFDFRYYSKKTILTIEFILAIFMILCAYFFALQFFLMILLYFPFLAFHIYVYLKLKKIEGNN
ncbi:MAG: hypothetical protein ACTSQP_06310 [Promethearchaeota archaeon]